MYSYHNFMFPFRFDKIIKKITDRHKYYRVNPFDDRVKIDRGFVKFLEGDGWIYKPYEIVEALDYNEFVYFHDFVRDTLYNREEFAENATSYYFNKKLHSASFSLSIKEGKTYILDLTGLSLRLFDTGIGILSIELENNKEEQSGIDDILKINEYGRRVYPQFLDSSNTFTDSAKKKFLPDKIEIILDENSKPIVENFDYKALPEDIEIGKHILGLLGENSFTISTSSIGKQLIQPIVDDRMFVMSWYGDDLLSDALKDYAYLKNDQWYQYVFVDGNGKTVQNLEMQEKLIREATYDRWLEYGTLYGMSRYSFSCISNSLSTLKENDADMIVKHIQTMYFQMFTLLLAQRASILRFSDEVTALSDIGDSNELAQRSSNLYKNYIRFVNKLYFREVTAQDQGLEIYNQARSIMRIDEDIKDLDNEIEELHKYVAMVEEQKSNKQINRITKFGAILIPPTLVAGILGMNIFNGEDSWLEIDNLPGTMVAIVLLLLSIGIGIKLAYRKDKNE